jgi:hypothetical protein
MRRPEHGTNNRIRRSEDMMALISGKEFALKSIFSNEFDFSIPSYQRPYAWTPDEAEELFEDVKAFMNRQQKSEQPEPYFLGSIVLIKQDNQPDAQVIDGQQRLTTVTILLRCLTERLEGMNGNSLEVYLNQLENPAEDLPAKPRLTLREQDRDFFHDYIQKSSGMPLLEKVNEADLSDPQKNMKANVGLFRKKLALMSQEEAWTFAKYLINSCYLVVVWTPSMQSAFRIFSVLNNRGLDLMPSDILKAEVVGAIPENLRGKYSRRWEDVEEELGRAGFNDLFGHIRMLHVKVKQKRTLVEEIRDFVLPNAGSPTSFIDDTLEPYGEAFEILKTAGYQSTERADEVNDLLRWLQKIDNIDWIPPAILFLHKNKHDAAILLRFLTSLEKLAAYLFLTRQMVNTRMDRYAGVLRAIENGIDLWGAGSPLLLTANEASDMVRQLNGDLYLSVSTRKYVLLRLDSWMSENIAHYDHGLISIEHVLPQTVGAGSEWEQLWPDQEKRQQWLHRLGNLVLLSRAKNSSAQNYDFGVKKEKYFKTKGGTSNFPLTVDVLNSPTWTEEVVSARQERLLSILKAGWRINTNVIT